MNMKQLCAKEALKYIKDGMCIGLGGGSTIGYLAEYLAKEERKITVVTPSDDTAASSTTTRAMAGSATST